MKTLRRLADRMPTWLLKAIAGCSLIVGVLLPPVAASVLVVIALQGLPSPRANQVGYVGPTVTVTITAEPGAQAPQTAQPSPGVTRYVSVPASGSGSSDGWIAVAAFGSLLVGVGTFALGAAALFALRRRETPQPDPQPKAADPA